jgi:hypothetical protein
LTIDVRCPRPRASGYLPQRPIAALDQGEEQKASCHATGDGMTVWIYVDTSKQVGDKDHLKVFANEDAAETWLQENDPEGVAFEYEVLE